MAGCEPNIDLKWNLNVVITFEIVIFQQGKANSFALFRSPNKLYILLIHHTITTKVLWMDVL